MTISISGTAAGSPDHTLVISAPMTMRWNVQCPGSFSVNVWKGSPLLLTEAGDPTEWVVVPKVSGARTITREELVIAFLAWGTAQANGECLSHEDAAALPIGERAQRDADALISFL